MFFSNEPILEIQWDSNCFNEQKVVYFVQFIVEKIKPERNRFRKAFRSFSFFSTGETFFKVIGRITRSDVEVKEKKLGLLLPPEIQKNYRKGDLLKLSISDKGWCIAIEKIAQ